jgi:imidazolonepropionase-like amidohydrolase
MAAEEERGGVHHLSKRVKSMKMNVKIAPQLLLVAAMLQSFSPLAVSAEQGKDKCNDSSTLIQSVRVFDGHTVIPEAHVTIQCERISQLIVADGPPDVPEGSIVIDGAGKTLMPGLFESHGHTFRRAMLERSLDFGVTTVLDMGSVSPDFVSTIRAEDAKHQATDRADLYSAVLWVTAPGSHGTQFGEVATLTEPADAAAFVAQRIEDGADFIKIIYDNFKMIDRPVPTLSKETMTAVVAAAHAQGKIAVVHSRDVEAYADVIEAGADGFVHTPVDEKLDAKMIAMIKAQDMYVGPNMSLLRPVGNRLIEDPNIGQMLSENERESLLGFRAMHRDGGETISEESVAALHAAGVTLLASSDSPNAGTIPGASMHLELELLVEIGLSPVEALQAATSNPARVFGIQDRGRIAEGLLADLLLVEGRPDENIRDTRRLHTVWKAGVAQ